MAGRGSKFQRNFKTGHKRSSSVGEESYEQGNNSVNRGRSSSFRRNGGSSGRASPIARGTYYTGNDPTDLTGWKEKLESDRKRMRHELIATFSRSNIYCRQHWQNGLVPVSKYLTQDAFKTLGRIIKHHEDENAGLIAPVEEVSLEGLRSRAGTL